MNKSIKIIFFIFICSCALAAVFVSNQGSDKPLQTHSLQNTDNSTLNDHLVDRMNHKIDTTIPKSIISFQQNSFDFGTIKNGDVVIHKFKFKNTGGNPLIIFNVQATCGCTVPAWSNAPVNSGNTADIIIKFNSANQSGLQNKVVKVFANSSPIETDIYFKANVIN